jgi:hypothetical protein
MFVCSNYPKGNATEFIELERCSVIVKIRYLINRNIYARICINGAGMNDLVEVCVVFTKLEHQEYD